MIVLDASIILKLIFKEKDTPLALQLRENHITGEDKIAAPELLYYELANVLATKVLMSVKNASSALAEIFNLEIETFTLGIEEFLSSIRVSHKYTISVYDASYVVLAERLNCDFITADVKLFGKITDLKLVRLLGSTV
ncbi:MAG: type II toxin-antitoxin system VapC family toxin [Candidatus Aminicenantes bacterium]|nr:type II toxin-antitoxin system VapC family toxin [Candidatus Aminicenantes bacterium]